MQQEDTATNTEQQKTIPVIGEICPAGTLQKLARMTALVAELQKLLAPQA